MVAGSGNSWSEHTDNSTDETELDEGGIRWFVRSPLETAKSQAGARERTGEGLGELYREKEWARRVRELRTEEGWPIVTRNSGRDDLAIGVYVLEEDRQTYEHDRSIPSA